MEAPQQQPGYPVQLAVEYPDRDLNRLTTAFRIIVAIPILVVAGAVNGPNQTTFEQQSNALVEGIRNGNNGSLATSWWLTGCCIRRTRCARS